MTHFAFHPADHIATLPPPRFLLEPFIQEHGRNEVYGDPGVGKSFLTLDWACCVAAGVDWNGHAVIGGPVVYLAAEGHTGLGVRLAAWKQSRGIESLPRLWVLSQAVNLLDPSEVAKVREDIATMPETPSLIVVDTLSRCMPGGDDSGTKDMGLYIAAVDGLARTWGATILDVHHTTKAGDEERGSGANRGATETMHLLKKDKSGLWLKCTRTKDHAPYESVRLHLEPFVESCVVTVGSRQRELDSTDRLILQSLPDENGSGRVATTQLQEVTGIPSTTFYNRLESLDSRGFVSTTKDGRFSYKWITSAGRKALLPITPNASQASTTTTPATPSPLRDGEW